MKGGMSFNLTTTGEGYAEVKTSEERVYIHRLSAVAEFGLEAIDGMDVHHEEHQWVNNPAKLSPEDPKEHRKLTLEGVESEVEG